MKFFLLLIKIYKLLVSPVLPRGCRFLPSCSDFAAEALLKHGVLQGVFLTVKRLLKCNPWGAHGFDPVPENLEKKI